MADLYINQTGFEGGVISPRTVLKENEPLYHVSIKDSSNWVVTQQGSILTRCGSKEIGVCQDGDIRLFRLPSLDPNQSDHIVEIGDTDVAIWVNDVREVIDSTPAGWIGTIDRIQTAFETQGDDAGLANTGRLILVHPSEAPKRIYRDNTNAWQFVDMHTGTLPPEWTASNYPWTVGIFQNRVWYVGSPVNRTNFWASEVGVLENIGDFADPMDPTPEEPLNFKGIMEGTPVWTIASSDVLTIGTSIDEYQLTASDGGSVTALTALLRRSSSHSSSRVQSKSAEEQVLFASRSQRKVYSINYIRAQDNWVADEISEPAEHLFTAPNTDLNRAILNMAHLPDANKGLWVLLTNGEANYCCFDKTTDVKAWTRIELGDPIKDIAVGFDIESDYMYAVVKRDKYISDVRAEYNMLEKVPAPRTNWRRADAWTEANVDGTGLVSDLDRYIDKEVVVFSEFGQEKQFKVTEEGQTYQIPFYDNTITYYVGYVIENNIVTLPPSIGNQKQTLAGSSLRTVSAQLSIYRSIPPTVDDNESEGNEPDDRGTEEVMDTRSLDFSSGSVDDGQNTFKPEYRLRGWEKDGSMEIKAREPFLCEIVGILSEVKSNRV